LSPNSNRRGLSGPSQLCFFPCRCFFFFQSFYNFPPSSPPPSSSGGCGGKDHPLPPLLKGLVITGHHNPVTPFRVFPPPQEVFHCPFSGDPSLFAQPIDFAKASFPSEQSRLCGRFFHPLLFLTDVCFLPQSNPFCRLLLRPASSVGDQSNGIVLQDIGLGAT